MKPESQPRQAYELTVTALGGWVAAPPFLSACKPNGLP